MVMTYATFAVGGRAAAQAFANYLSERSLSSEQTRLAAYYTQDASAEAPVARRT
jgi:hypothetical protein